MSNGKFGYPAVGNYKHVIALRAAGTNVPLICFPGSGGNPNIFCELTLALPDHQPVYALDMGWLCETTRDFSVEEIAEFYVDFIRSIQEIGPYYFCGYSFGGLVAYETARRLMEQGDQVSLLALLDAPNPALLANLPPGEAAHFRKTYLADRIKSYTRYLIQGDIAAFAKRGLAFAISRASKSLLPLIKRSFQAANINLPAILRSNDPGFLKAWNSYTPRAYQKSLVCFRGEERGPEHDRDPSMGWSICATGGIEVHIVPGSHVNMMAKPSVVFIANVISTYFKNTSEMANIGDNSVKC